MRDIIKLSAILFIITAIAAVLLGYTNSITKDTIEDQIRLENEAARKAVMPSGENFEQVDQDTITEIAKELNFKDINVISEVYAVKKGSEVIGYTFKSLPKGFGGEISLLTGISIEEKVTGMKVISHSETPGLGAKSTEDVFQDQYKDKPVENPLVVVKTKPVNDNEIQAITGSTITSSAVTDGVNLSLEIFKELINRGVM
ncbi:MAG: RnfABCDGE type electron transport complex subunit G [Eubacteriales bacterium]